MKYVVLNPYWNVPPIIANGEYLPKLKKQSRRLCKRQNIRVFSGSGDSARSIPIASTGRRLSRMPYSLRQDSGRKNALGKVKFMFPNRFNVYLHDTPSKSLFNKDLRIFSHGCMRVQNPLDLAALLLADQGWTRTYRCRGAGQAARDQSEEAHPGACDLSYRLGEQGRLREFPPRPL